MRYKAVIFDLFGTLIPSFSQGEYHEKVNQIACMVKAPQEDFWKIWAATLTESMLGTIPSLEAKIVHICQKLGIKVVPSQISQAEKSFFEYEAKYMLPRPGGVEVLSKLKAAGLKTGLISDCSSEGPLLWKKTPLAFYIDAAIFSCLVNMQKPDPRIYLLALQQLAVAPQDCLYVGDGGSFELTGAERVGLQAVQLRVPDESDTDVFRINKEDWQGKVIASLKEVLMIIKT